MVVHGFQNVKTSSTASRANENYAWIMKESNNDNNELNNFSTELDQDATPLFEEPVTLFGLEPKTELDPLDNGLTFTGPIILLASIYFTISLWFVDDIPPLDSIQ